ncbi:type IV secretion system protein [Brucella anthropi]|uniref:type IV secretion system protein n=1 Tax=Brucella anthropi TaxID=529 RepID=UPI002157DE0A|nr:type IV secretion system protein [Brucella anthropi]MCR8493693.1 type IV secretion system protein [Brucella anthropi]
MAKINPALESELVFGAMDRERRWRRISYCSMLFGALGCLMAGAVAVSVDKPAPELVPFDVRNGVVLPNVNVSSISTTQKDAIIESLVYSYVGDRETYNAFDNDLRIGSVVSRSTGRALDTLKQLWDSGSPDYLPAQYSDKARIDVAISSINLLSDNRAQIQIRKRLTSPDGVTEGAFLVTLEYELTPARKDSLEAVWKNPFGFVVTNYRVAAQQYERG